MNFKTINRWKLTELIDPCDIISIVPITDFKVHKKYLAIGIKGRLKINIRYYGETHCNINYITVSKFSYGVPNNIAIPTKYYDNIIIEERYCKENDLITYLASIIKPIKY